MHPAMTIKIWIHHLHDDVLRFEHALGELLRSRHFWMGAFVALLFVGLMMILLLWAMRSQPGTIDGFDYMYPYMHYRV